jgi:hypothetical protein
MRSLRYSLGNDRGRHCATEYPVDDFRLDFVDSDIFRLFVPLDFWLRCHIHPQTLFRILDWSWIGLCNEVLQRGIHGGMIDDHCFNIEREGNFRRQYHDDRCVITNRLNTFGANFMLLPR